MKKFLTASSIFVMIALAVCLFSYSAYGINLSLNELNDNKASSKVTFYTTNDVHGAIDSETGLSYNSVAQLKERSENDAYIVDAGDHTGGSPYANYDAGMTIVKLMKEANYDFVIPGNHEFDVGTDHFFNDILTSAKNDKDIPETSKPYEYYACNFYNLQDGKEDSLCLEPYKIFDIYNPIKKSIEQIALIGIMTPETMAKTAPGYFQDKDGNWIYEISSNENDNKMLNKKINDTIIQAKGKGAEYCIGVGHLGINANETPYNKSTDVIYGVNSDGDEFNLDAFIDGHSHDYATYPVREFLNADMPENPYIIAGWDEKKINDYAIPYIQTGTAFSHIGKMDLSFDELGNLNIVTDYINKYNYIDDQTKYPISFQTNKDLYEWVNNINSNLSTQIATSKTYFYDNDVKDSSESSTRLTRRRESNLSDLCADSLYWYANANYEDCDIAIINGGGIRSALYESNNILTMLNCVNALPYQNEFSIAKIKGSVILDALEFSARGFGVLSKDKKTTVEIAGLLHTSGLTYLVDDSIKSSVKIEDDIWQGPPTDKYRIKNVQVYNKQKAIYEDLDLNKTYTVAGTRYFFQCYGDGFAMFRGCESTNYKSLLSEVLANYLKSFDAHNTNALPEISTENSPLNKYPNFMINYENKYGANRTGIHAFNFDTNEGSYVAPQYLFIDGYAYCPQCVPTKDNCIFESWCEDKSLTNRYDFATILNSDKTVYAKWNEKAPAPLDDDNNSSGAQTSDNISWGLMFTLLAFVLICFMLIILSNKTILLKE